MAKIKTKPTFLIPTKEHHDAIKWCLKNNIKIGALPTKDGLKVEINDNGKRKISDNVYENYQVSDKCWELYLYIYKKYFKL